MPEIVSLPGVNRACHYLVFDKVSLLLLKPIGICGLVLCRFV